MQIFTKVFNPNNSLWSWIVATIHKLLNTSPERGLAPAGKEGDCINDDRRGSTSVWSGWGTGRELKPSFLMHPSGSRDLNWVWQETSTDSPQHFLFQKGLYGLAHVFWATFTLMGIIKDFRCKWTDISVSVSF